MRSLAGKIFILIASLFLLCGVAFAGNDYGCGVTTPYSIGSGVTIIQCWGAASGNQNLSSFVTGVYGGGMTAGDSLLIIGYQCYPYGSGGSNPCQWTPASTTYLFPCYSSTQSTCATTNLISDGSCTQLYSAFLQTGYNGNSYPNYVWYCKSLPSGSGGVGILGGINLMCSSTSASFTPASTCDYISIFLIEFTGGCTTDNTACFDQGGNYPGVSQTTSMTVSTSGSTHYTNELVCALGGTVNDETLAATNGGAVMTVGNATPVQGNTTACKTAATTGTQTLGFTWSGNDYGGAILVSMLTAESVPAGSSQNAPPMAGAMR